MGWVLVAVVGAVLVAAIAAACAVLLARRRNARRAGVFRCCVRVTSGSPSGLRSRSPLAVRYASWTHDVLVLRHGPALVRMSLLPVESAIGTIEDRHSAAPWLLGSRVASLPFRLDDGSTIEVSAPVANKAELSGPYLLAALADSPARASPRRSDPGP